jgi:hypothetical protein
MGIKGVNFRKWTAHIDLKSWQLKKNLGSPQNEAKFGQVGNAALVMWSGGNQQCKLGDTAKWTW